VKLDLKYGTAQTKAMLWTLRKKHKLYFDRQLAASETASEENLQCRAYVLSHVGFGK
jgi:hypothetical protein